MHEGSTNQLKSNENVTHTFTSSVAKHVTNLSVWSYLTLPGLLTFWYSGRQWTFVIWCVYICLGNAWIPAYPLFQHSSPEPNGQRLKLRCCVQPWVASVMIWTTSALSLKNAQCKFEPTDCPFCLQPHCLFIDWLISIITYNRILCFNLVCSCALIYFIYLNYTVQLNFQFWFRRCWWRILKFSFKATVLTVVPAANKSFAQFSS